MSDSTPALRRLVLVLALVDLGLGLGAGVGGLFAGLRLLLALSAGGLLLSGLLFGTWLAAGRRARTLPDKPKADTLVEGQWALTIVVGAALLPVWIAAPPEEVLGLPWVGAGLGMAGVVVALQARFLRDAALPEGAGLASWARMMGWGIVVSAAGLGAWQLGWVADLDPWAKAMATTLAAVLGVIGLRTVALSRPWKRDPEALLRTFPAADLGLVRAVFSRWNPLASLLDELERGFGVDLKSTWALQVLRRSLEPLGVGLVVAGWLSTGLVQLEPHEEGVRERFGKPGDQVLGPGLHVGLPWPLDKVRRVETGRVHTVVVGHAEDEPELQTGLLGWLFASEVQDEHEEEIESRLWAKQHGEEEFTLLLGDGHDLVSLDGLLHYRITDPAKWLYSCQNPEERIEAAAYRALMLNTSDKTLEQALSENLLVLADDIRDDVAAQVALADIGAEIVAFNLAALHPPVMVAVDYQSVVSAQIDRERQITEAEGYRMGFLPMARTDALLAINGANADATTRLADARGEAAAFTAVARSYRASPDLFRFRRRMDVLEANLENQRLYILDDRFEAQGGNVWLME